MTIFRGVCGVYGLFDPRDGRCRYVGQSEDVQRRVADHLRIGGPSRVQQLGFELRQAGHAGLEPRLLEEVGHFSELDEAERRWVAKMREGGQADLNQIPGGAASGRTKWFKHSRADWDGLIGLLEVEAERLTTIAQRANAMLPARDVDRLLKAVQTIQLVRGNAQIEAANCPEQP